MSEKQKLIEEELEEIAQAHGGVLYPADVVEYAKDENTALHSQFDWDDETASHKYRLWQARYIIHMRVTVIEEAKTETRMFVSLKSDRIAGGGYRYTVDVMSDHERRKELLGEAYRNFKSWQAKYNQLKELGPVFDAMESVIAETQVMALPIAAPAELAA